MRAIPKTMDRWLSGRAVLRLSAILGMAASLSFAQSLSPGPEVQVTSAPIPDNEYDSGRDGVLCDTCNFGARNARFVFSDADNNLWVAQIDSQTGNFIPHDGHGLLLDTNATAPTDYGNGPEWFESASGSGFVYTQFLPGQPHSDSTAVVGIATMVNGAWTINILSGATGRASPDATKNPSDPDVYINYVSAPKGKLYWRKLSDINTEHELPISGLTDGNARRWVPGTHSIVFQGQLSDRVKQIYMYDIDTGVLEQLTASPTDLTGVFMWRAPEFNNELVFLTMAKDRTQILVYRKLPGADKVLRWTVIKTITGPAALPYFFSPEPFVHNGRSYVFTEASSSFKFFDLTIPNQIMISGIHPLRVDARLVTNETSVFRVRLDPEYYVTAQGPFVYYNRLVPETDTHPAANDGLWRVDLGLGPRKP
ncbi:MAG TPA: hypothetical protein VGI48_09740 [Caldimonas sp.]